MKSVAKIIANALYLAIFLTIFLSAAIPNSVLSQTAPTTTAPLTGKANSMSLSSGQYANGTSDYYNATYTNAITSPNIAVANITQFEILQSNNGWTKVQSWVEQIGNSSNVMAVFSDNGGRSYSEARNICPGGITKFTGINGREFWVFCEVRNLSTGHTDVFLQELSTGATPYSTLTNVSNNPSTDSIPLGLAVNPITGQVDWTWKEAGDGVTTDCYRC